MTRDKRFYLTYIIIGINAAICILMFFIDRSLNLSVGTLIAFGAKYNPMIAAGQYYRIITSMFLHSDITHLLFNMYALNILGKNIEYVYGKTKFIIIYLIAGIFGGLGSFIFSKSVAVGASGAIFGLLGAYLYLYLSKPHIFNTKYLKNLLTVIGINLLFGIIVPNIDNWAHICGLIGGFIISSSLGIRGEKYLNFKKITAQILIVVLICAILLIGINLNQNTWQYNLFKGIDYLRDNNIERAEHQFKLGIEKNSNVEDFYFYLGHINYNKGNLTEARNNFKKALDINPYFTEAEKMLKGLQ